MAPDAERPTHLLHRLTCYTPDREWTEVADDDRLVQDLVPNDVTRRPQPYKRYDDDLRRILLPPELSASSAPASAVLAGTADVPPTRLDLSGLSRLLHLSAGVTRRTQRPDGGVMLFRAAGSAGARFPLELYVAVPRGSGVDGLEPGLHWYDPEAHALVVLGPPPSGEAVTLVVTGVPWRTGWRYRERGYRHIYWDAGTMLAQTLALADSGGLTARLFTAFPDAEVAALVGADRVHEFPVALVALGPGGPAVHPTGDPMPGHHDADGVEFPLVTAAQRAGERSTLGPELQRGAPVALTSSSGSAGTDEVIASKGSIRRLHRDRSLPREVLVDAMAVSLRGIDVPHWVGVSAVDDVPTGIHLWPDLSSPVRPLAEQSVRDELFTAALEQGLAGDASFVAMSGIPLDELDDHGYREAQLLAGLAEGRLHLMAYALGAAASGMTFRDTDLAHLLGRDVAGLLWTCVGVPEYRTRPSGAPGSPADVTIVWPR
ncbi:hypothetical protein FHX52_0197 [Humibacillus xanthopallidus]|uniref:SagB-type dehydrogenase family enzyme n=1 Tax=Humibacillus xanthopallidus TaxID=412689 RepID=A0A543PST8_9MICO|nr:hypothetical protein [Humibacillus xanthopallidus]TQN47106.1 hypothetical protein FHX52_0197 [Humibacillus xanthopallidus]